LLFVAGLSAAHASGAPLEAPQATVAEAAGASAPGPAETKPLVTEAAPSGPLSTRNRSISPDRPGINLTFSAEVTATAFVSNRITQRFIAFPSPGFKLSASVPFMKQHFFAEGEARQLNGSATLPCNSFIQNFGKCLTSGNVPRFSAQEWIIEERGGVQIPRTPVHLGVATFYSATNFGFPDMVGVGFGAEIRPDYSKPTSVFGRFYFYPNLHNEDDDLSPGSTLPIQLRYRMARYEVAVSKKVGKSRQMLQAGIDGSSTRRLVSVPISMTKVKLFVSSGLRF